MRWQLGVGGSNKHQPFGKCARLYGHPGSTQGRPNRAQIDPRATPVRPWTHHMGRLYAGIHWARTLPRVAQTAWAVASTQDDEAMPTYDEEESEEARRAGPAHDPGAPTKAEYDWHMLTHMAYHAWCPWCVAERGRTAQHRRDRREGEEGVPVVALDFCFITASSTPVLCLKSHRQVHCRACDEEQGSH